MKKIAILLLVAIISVSCKTESKKDASTSSANKKKENFPSELAKVFEKHGGIDEWRKMRTLSFNRGDEAHTTDLWSRKTVVNEPNYSLGYDGSEVWLSQKDSTSFKSNPTFYYNLYFYFYTMPFVLADDGITYEKIEPLVFKGEEYPGFKISFTSEKGTSPDDNYVIYYNAETHQMEWLGYTVTYYSKKSSDKFNIIRYNDWENVGGFKLPKSITWYKKDEKGAPTEPARPATEFSLSIVNKTALDDSFFKKPTEE
ncbi:MAG: hypothetical protein JXR05_03970 [Flavobacteriaceae bacterium]